MASTPAGKKPGNQCGAVFRKYAFGELDPVIEPGFSGKLFTADDGAGPGLPGAEYEPGDPGVNQGADTHRAGFNRDVKRRARQAVVADTCCCLTQSADFRVGGGVAGAYRAVAPAAHNAAIAHEHRAHWHFPGRLGFPGECKGDFHEFRIVLRILYNGIFSRNMFCLQERFNLAHLPSFIAGPSVYDGSGSLHKSRASCSFADSVMNCR